MSSEAIGWVFRYSPCAGAAFQVHLAVADSVNDQYENRFWMAAKNVATKSRVSERAARSALHELVAQGLLELIEERRGKPSEYRFLFPELSAAYESRAARRAGVTDSRAALSAPVTAQTPATDDANDAQPLHTVQPNPSNQGSQQGLIPTSVDVSAVFDAWARSTGKSRAVLDDKRRRRIFAAFKLGYSVDELVDAVRGWRHSAHHRGENERRTVYNELDLLLRDAAHIEQFRDLERGEGRAGPRVSKSYSNIDAAARRLEEVEGEQARSRNGAEDAQRELLP